jgi:hypothetical protein
MTMEEEGQHQLEKVPNAIIGRAIKDKEFRHKVLDNKNDMAALNSYLREQRLPVLNDAAYAIIKGLDRDKVDEALAGVDVEATEAFA